MSKGPEETLPQRHTNDQEALESLIIRELPSEVSPRTCHDVYYQKDKR